MTNKVILIFPPATDPRSPHLSLPSLTSFLRKSGVFVKQIDADLEGFLYITRKENILESIVKCKILLQKTNNNEVILNLKRLLKYSDYVLNNIENSIFHLRDKNKFYNPFVYIDSRECISRALEIISAANYPVRYNTSPIGYDVLGFNASKLNDLLILTADIKYNIFNSYYQEILIPLIKTDNPDIIGISILNFQQVIPGLTLARLLKKMGYFVVIGGTLYSKFVQQLLVHTEFLNTFCDGIVPYEGETAILEILDQINKNKDLSKVPNFIHLNNFKKPIIGKIHVENVNLLPTPDFNGLPLEKYLSPEIVLPILTGKGCYFNHCKFCDIPFINSISSKAYRIRSSELVANDIHLLNKQHQARFFQITDESMSPNLLINLADSLDYLPNIEPRFVGYSRLEAGFTPQVFERIYQLGVRKLFFGLESGSQKTLDHMKKGINISKVPTILKNCLDSGIAFHLFSIIGFPEETEIEANKTINFFLKNKALLNPPQNSYDIHPFMLDLRTDYSNNAEKYGIEINDNKSIDFPISVDKWKNIKGMHEDIVTMKINHFHEILRKIFPEYRRFPIHLWPTFEEHSILYIDKFKHNNFLYRFNLPPNSSTLIFSFVWSNSLIISKSKYDFNYDIDCLTGSFSVSKVIIKFLLAQKNSNTVMGYFNTFLLELKIKKNQKNQIEKKLRNDIDSLISIGALYIIPLEKQITIP